MPAGSWWVVFLDNSDQAGALAYHDLTNEGLRRLVVNGVYWGLGLEVPAKADVTLVDEYQPSFYGFGGERKGLKVADLGLGKGLPKREDVPNPIPAPATPK